MSKVCPSCLEGTMKVFHSVKKFPVHTVLNMKTRDIAVNFPVGDIDLGFCDTCGFISNISFDGSLLHYSPDCEETQGFSATFNEFSINLAKRLIEKYDLHGKDIIEIGCGKGEFLIQLCEYGNNRGLGFDPAYVDGRFDNPILKQIEFIKDYYSEKYTDKHADFICCKMTLEHIWDTYEFVKTVRKSIGDRLNTIVFFQVPDVIRILEDCAFEDIYFEHCSYFSPGSLAKLFNKCGFELLDISSEYNGQYLTIEVKPVKDGIAVAAYDKEKVSDLAALVAGFEESYKNKIDTWRQRFTDFHAQNKKVVIWGSGSKGVAFLSALKDIDIVEKVVDINPNRQGTFMAGTGQEIVSPQSLCDYKPDAVIVMNEVYKQEIENDLKKLHLNPDVYTL